MGGRERGSRAGWREERRERERGPLSTSKKLMVPSVPAVARVLSLVKAMVSMSSLRPCICMYGVTSPESSDASSHTVILRSQLEAAMNLLSWNT
jgi:hypothetical protein